MPGPVGKLMRQGAVVALGISEQFEGGHEHPILSRDIASHSAYVVDLGACCGNEVLGMADPLHGVELRFGSGAEVRGETVDLLAVEDRIGLHEWDHGSVFLARVVLVLAGDPVRVDDKAASLTSTNLP